MPYSDGMETTPMYGPETPERVHRIASLHAARYFGSEAVRSVPISGDDTTEVIVYEVVGTHPKGWAIFGRDVIVTVNDDDSGYLTEDIGDGRSLCVSF